jgi:hypothetical protein
MLFATSLYGQGVVVDPAVLKGKPLTAATFPATNQLNFCAITSTCATNRWYLDVSSVVESIRLQGDMTYLVTKLAADGDLCAVFGHQWQSGCGQENCVVLHSHIFDLRCCRLCKKTQEMKWE